MTKYREIVGDKLNDILEKNYDAEKGFKKAADNAKNEALKSYFKNRAQERGNFKSELKSEIASYGQKFDTSGSATGTAHRAWMDVKSLFSSDNDDSMLEEAIKGEKASVEEYEDVLAETSLPPTTKMLLLKQKNKIERNLSTIKSLEDLK
ncbi:PA2169 family four-helix-bundle protein [Aureibaculum sp. 2210JD6-5]|uniref:ferritin-like domain-containing protein n=1 Tax=Aureibaculum sp. 2210JD6-5 TaxID=3103957 RepID=UPI002AAC78AB|nr:PA2169 family four-helix-bundle protein [Aureibaculum sp. 2210JD6-5]MDY7396630.1 PA2169 family four-helix-bundle protein [Aureibaculum sp. 2210JD6-5]